MLWRQGTESLQDPVVLLEVTKPEMKDGSLVCKELGWGWMTGKAARTACAPQPGEELGGGSLQRQQVCRASWLLASSVPPSAALPESPTQQLEALGKVPLGVGGGLAAKPLGS